MEVKCPHCKKKFKNEFALKIHVGLVHLNEVLTTLDNNRPEVYIDDTWI